MKRTRVIPFQIDHLDQSWIDLRHREAFEIMAGSATVRDSMIDKYAVTFVDQLTGQVLGCFGVLRQTAECWAFLNRRLLGQDCYAHQKFEIVRKCKQLLEERNKEYGEPSYARVDGSEVRDEKFLTTIGFRYIGDEWYMKGKYWPRPEEMRGQHVDISL